MWNRRQKSTTSTPEQPRRYVESMANGCTEIAQQHGPQVNAVIQGRSAAAVRAAKLGGTATALFTSAKLYPERLTKTIRDLFSFPEPSPGSEPDNGCWAGLGSGFRSHPLPNTASGPGMRRRHVPPGWLPASRQLAMLFLRPLPQFVYCPP
jgi:hypothetical protein